MQTVVYRKLQSHFHKHPLGFPETKDQVELKILQWIFNEEEAEMALNLTIMPETAKILALRLNKDFKELVSLLERMADKGQIFTLDKGGDRSYMLVPYAPGFWDFQVKKMDRDFAEFSEAYYAPQAREMFSSATPRIRVVTVEKNIPAVLKVYPFELASQIVREAKRIALTDCICRKKNKLLGKGCQGPHEEMCLQLSPGAEFYIERGLGREVSVDEAMKVIEMGEKAGLVRTAWLNVQKRPFAFCQCCTCCCHGLRTVYELKIPNAVAKSNFVPAISGELCTGCGSCADICPMDALTLDGTEKAVRNPGSCIGCGLCVSSCSAAAIVLDRVDKEQLAIPPDNHINLLLTIAQEKGKPLL
ncbi:MAG: 4Fe-4S binding protein [Proteobacteria bacterium]|nr:4Fe-4S binding protein [Pseudomonadota bacterium]